MITLDNALKTFKKYGYNSDEVQPYLYKKNNEVGVNYSYIDSKYGITERVISFHQLIDLDLFLKRFQWYKLNGKKEGVTLKLDNYEIAEPGVMYIRNNHVMTDNEMFNIKEYDKKEEKNKKATRVKRKLIEAQNLMNYYYVEKEKEEKYTNNLFKKEQELKRYYYDLQNLIDKYNKTKSNISLEDSNKTFKVDLSIESEINAKLNEYSNKLPKELELENLIDKIWNLNKSLEINPSYMYAYHYNDDIDEELRLTVTKLDFMKELLSKKRWGIIDLKKKFNNIDNQSTYESIYDENFEEKYKEFIEKKYSVKDRINEFRLSEYLINFKTKKEYDIERNVKRCEKERQLKKEPINTNVNDLNISLTKQFNKNLNDKEKYALILYVSIYKEIIDLIQSIDNYEAMNSNEILNILSITDNFNSLLEESYTKIKKLLELDINKNIKTTVFNDISFKDTKSFIKSLKDIIKIIKNINSKIVLNSSIKLYFSTNNIDELTKKKFITTSSIISPFLIQNKKDYKVIDAYVTEKVNVLFSPKVVVISTLNDKIEVIDKESPDIILDSNDINIINDNNTLIYTKFKYNIVDKKNYKYVDKYDINYKININKIRIEKRNNNG